MDSKLRERLTKALREWRGVRLTNDETRTLCNELGLAMPEELPTAEIEKPKPKQRDIHIRWMIRRDMPEVLDIERRSFDEPWDEEDFVRALRQGNCIGMVVERHETVVGYMVYELHKRHIYLTKLAVDYDHRWQGVGRAMIDKLLSKLSSQRRMKLTANIGERNLEGQKFFAVMGFTALGMRSDTFSDEAAIEFERCLTASHDA